MSGLKTLREPSKRRAKKSVTTTSYLLERATGVRLFLPQHYSTIGGVETTRPLVTGSA